MKIIIKLTALLWFVTFSSIEAAPIPNKTNNEQEKKGEDEEEPKTTPVSRKRYRSRFSTVAQAAPQTAPPVGPKMSQEQINKAMQRQATQQQQAQNNPNYSNQQQIQQNLQRQKQMQQQMQMQQAQSKEHSGFKRKKPNDIAAADTKAPRKKLSLFSWKKKDTTVAEATIDNTPQAPAAPAPTPPQPIDPPTNNHPASFYPKEKKRLLQVLREQPNLSTFANALETAGLDIQITEDGPYTIFAPTNEAFNQLPRGAMERLMKPENHRQLYSILAYHIIPGKLPGSDIKTAKVRTINGKELNVEVSRGNIMIDDAEVVKQDIQASNGIIHIVDEVALPN